jgi:hypothetical protein
MGEMEQFIFAERNTSLRVVLMVEMEVMGDRFGL